MSRIISTKDFYGENYWALFMSSFIIHNSSGRWRTVTILVLQMRELNSHLQEGKLAQATQLVGDWGVPDAGVICLQSRHLKHAEQQHTESCTFKPDLVVSEAIQGRRKSRLFILTCNICMLLVECLLPTPDRKLYEWVRYILNLCTNTGSGT